MNWNMRTETWGLLSISQILEVVVAAVDVVSIVVVSTECVIWLKDLLAIDWYLWRHITDKKYFIFDSFSFHKPKNELKSILIKITK